MTIRNRLPGRPGFTLIELLVVVTIIAILSAVGLSTFAGAQKKSRDARRRADIKSIQNALEQYYIANYVYACAAGSMFDTGAIPVDPRNGGSYQISCSATGYKYCADLENDGTWSGSNQDVCVNQLQ